MCGISLFILDVRQRLPHSFQIKFMYVDYDKTLAFLDVKFNLFNGSSSPSVYRKPPFTRLLIDFESFLPVVYCTKILIYILTRSILLLMKKLLNLWRLCS